MPSWLSGACFKNEVKQKIGEEIEVDAQAGQVRVAGIECDIKGVCVCVCVLNFSLPFTTHTHTHLSLSFSVQKVRERKKKWRRLRLMGLKDGA